MRISYPLFSGEDDARAAEMYFSNERRTDQSPCTLWRNLMKDDTDDIFKTNPGSDEEKGKSGSEEFRNPSSVEISSEEGTDAEDSYQFIHQVIRKKPRNYKAQILRILSIIGIGAAIGAVSAFVHAGLYPAAKKVLGADNEKITIPEDSDPEAVGAVSASSGNAVLSASSAAVSSESGGEMPDPSPTESASSESAGGSASGSGTLPESAPGETSSESTEENGTAESPGSSGITLEDYQQLYQDMLKTADEAKRSLVEVIGITSQLDYFNEDYQTQQQVAGILIAETDDNDYILTESSVVEGSENIMVKFDDNSMVQATLRKSDSNTGLAVLTIAPSDISERAKSELAVAPLGNSYSVRQGDPVLALGNLMGYSDIVANGTVTSVSNKISALDAEYSILTTDIEGSSTSSGILVNMKGEIIGLIPQNISDGGTTITAYAISGVKALIQKLSNNETTAYLGIKGREVTESLSQTTGIPVGLLVTEVAQDSPAMLAGFKEYDVITEISGKQIRTVQDLENILSNFKANNVITVTAMRQGADGYAQVTFSAALGEK